MKYAKEVNLGARTTEEVIEDLAAEGITAKVDKKPKTAKTKKSKTPKTPTDKKENTSGLITVKDLEKEFGIKAKIIRRHLRKMEESTKERNSTRYEWDPKSEELKAIRKNLKAITTKKSA